MPKFWAGGPPEDVMSITKSLFAPSDGAAFGRNPTRLHGVPPHDICGRYSALR
jgi:hypothetical protein